MMELVKTNIKKILRSRGLLFATVFFPLIFIGVFGIAFQSGSGPVSTVDIGIVASDAGVPAEATMFNHSGVQIKGTALQQGYLDLLEELTYEDEETPIFELTYYQVDEEDAALKLVEQGQLAGLLTLAEDFSLGLMAAFRSQYHDSHELAAATADWQGYPAADYNTSIELVGDQSLQGFGIASSVISTLTALYFDFTQQPDNYHLAVDGSIATEELTAFDFIVPGLVVFGLMQTLGIVANSALDDVESGLLDRMRITSMSHVEYVGAMIISQLMVAVVQIPIFFGAAVMFGFPFSSQIAIAFIFAVLISLSMTGIGLLIAALVSTADSATTVANMISTPMAFLAGAFFTVPNPTLIEDFISGNSLGLMDLLPPTSAIQGLRLVLIGGRSVAEVGYHLGLLGVLTMVLLVSGLMLYSRKHFSARN